MKQAKRGRIRVVGTVLLKGTGRPENVFCKWRPKMDNLEHEVLLTEVLLRFLQYPIVRGYDVNRELRPDAEVTIGQKFLIEFDSGKMDYRDIEKRFKKYEQFTGTVIWIAPTDTRAYGLRMRAERIKHCAFFTTLDAILREPYGGVLVNFDGEVGSVLDVS